MQYIFTILCSFIVSLASYPFVKKFAFSVDAICYPTKERHIHTKPIPLMGGLSIIFGVVVSIIVNYFFNKEFFATRELIGLCIGILIIALTGMFDDIVDMRAISKAIFILLGGSVALLISNSRIDSISNPFNTSMVLEFSPILSFFITLGWVFALTTAFNLIDGLDGLAAGSGTICALTLLAVSIIRPDAAMVGTYAGIMVAALAGACLGFLPFNFNPAKIFMGETGSAFIGFTLAIVSLQGTFKTYTAISILIPLIAFGIPVLDSVLAFSRRIIKKKPFYVGDKEHIHHKLIDMGLSQRASVLILYSANIILGIVTVLLAGSGMKYFAILVGLLLILIIVSVIFLYKPNKQKKLEEKVEEEIINEEN